MKLTYTIILVFFASHLLATTPATADTTTAYTDVYTTTMEPSGEAIIEPSRIAADDTGMIGNGSEGEDETLDSVLGYFIFIFFSVLVIILIDNRNLEKRYKKLVADYKNKE